MVLDEYYKKDGKDFLDAGVNNSFLYENSIEGTRYRFMQLVDNSTDVLEFEDHQRLRSLWHHRALEFFNKNPTRFPHPDSSDFETENSND